jgi:hypothetical protein
MQPLVDGFTDEVVAGCIPVIVVREMQVSAARVVDVLAEYR